MKNSRWIFLLLPFALIILPLQAIAVESQSPPKLPTPGTVIRPFLKTGSQGVEVSELQAALKLLGFYSGAVNGIYAASTATAVSKFQAAAGLKPNGAVGQETWSRLFPASPTGNQSNPEASISAANFPVPAATSKPTNNSSSSASTATKPSKPTNSSNSATTATKPSKPANSSNSATTATKPVKSTTIAVTIAAQPVATVTTQTSSIELPILKVGTQGPAVTRLQERLRTLGFFAGPVSGFFGPNTEAAVKDAQQRYKLDPDGVVGPGTWNVLLR